MKINFIIVNWDGFKNTWDESEFYLPVFFVNLLLYQS